MTTFSQVIFALPMDSVRIDRAIGTLAFLDEAIKDGRLALRREPLPTNFKEAVNLLTERPIEQIEALTYESLKANPHHLPTSIRLGHTVGGRLAELGFRFKKNQRLRTEIHQASDALKQVIASTMPWKSQVKIAYAGLRLAIPIYLDTLQFQESGWEARAQAFETYFKAYQEGSLPLCFTRDFETFIVLKG